MYNSGNSSKNVTGASVVDGTLYTVDIADDAVTADKLANTVNADIATGVAGSTTAGDALPKAGGAMTGAITTNSTFDGRDVATDGTALDVLDLAINSSANATAITIDASENVGIGVTPAGALQSDTTVLQIGSSGVLAARKTAEDVYLSSNSYYDTTWALKRITANQASAIEQVNGKITFKVAPSDTAGSTITFTTGFEVLNDGKARAPNGLLFGTDTAAANALDNYEEGTWTPNLSYTTPGATSGIYTVIGKMCHWQARYSWTAVNATGNPSFSLPFTADVSIGSDSIAALIHINYGITALRMLHSYSTTQRMNMYNDVGALFGVAGVSATGTLVASGSYRIA